MSEAVSWPERLSRTWPFWGAVALLALLLILNLAKGGKSAEVEPDATGDGREYNLGTRVFDTPGNFGQMLASPPAPPIRSELDPFAGLGDEEAESEEEESRPRLRTSKDLLEEAGIGFPPGAWVEFSPEKDQLEAHTTPENHHLIQAYLDYMENDRESLVQLQVRIYSMDTNQADQLVRRTMSEPDHTELMKDVHALSVEKKATCEDLLSVLCRSGQRTLTQTGEAQPYIEGYDYDESWIFPTVEVQHIGTVLETDCIIGPDAYTIDLVFDLRKDLAPAEVITKLVEDSAVKREFEVEALRTERFGLQTSITLWDGATRLVGVGPAKRVEGEPQRTLLVFATTNLVKS